MHTFANVRLKSREPFAVYVHIPYCLRKCPYCDFNSYGISQQAGGRTARMEEEPYTAALERELTHYAGQDAWKGRQVYSVFFGGGTPSLFSRASIERVLSGLSACFTLVPSAEITLEANPGTVQEELGREKLREFRNCGINRISMGAQSFSPRKLKILGRWHSAGDIANAVSNIRRAGFENFNLDLMFGIQEESLEEWRYDLARLVALSPPHCSAYGLTIEPGTEFGKRARRGACLLAAEDDSAFMYEYTQKTLERHGYTQYEISNFARERFQCLHNLAYWSNYDYLGLGAGAHSYLEGRDSPDGESLQSGKIQKPQEAPFGRRWSNIPKPEHYIERVQTHGCAEQRSEVLNRENAEVEFFFLGLRKKDGVNADEYEQRFGAKLFPRYQSTVERLQAEALLLRDFDTIRLTQKGLLFSDYVFQVFTTGNGPTA